MPMPKPLILTTGIFFVILSLLVTVFSLVCIIGLIQFAERIYERNNKFPTSDTGRDRPFLYVSSWRISNEFTVVIIAYFFLCILDLAQLAFAVFLCIGVWIFFEEKTWWIINILIISTMFISITIGNLRGYGCPKFVHGILKQEIIHNPNYNGRPPQIETTTIHPDMKGLEESECCCPSLILGTIDIVLCLAFILPFILGIDAWVWERKNPIIEMGKQIWDEVEKLGEQIEPESKQDVEYPKETENKDLPNTETKKSLAPLQ